jgi:hypothetical protein
VDIAGIGHANSGVAVDARGIAPGGGRNSEYARLEVALIVDNDADIALGAGGRALSLLPVNPRRCSLPKTALRVSPPPSRDATSAPEKPWA